MKVYKRDLEKITQPIVASIGFFDGVHRGHVYLIEQIITEAKRRNLPVAVITFKNHPRVTLDDGYQPALLTWYEEKLNLLDKLGVDICIPLDFTEELSRMSARDFMSQILKKELNVDTLIIGYDHRFGHDRIDGFAEYVEYGKELGISVFQEKELDEDEYVSSSQIRKLIQKGEVDKAAQLLGYNYMVEGIVIKGNQVGRSIGFPTANLQLPDESKVLPPDGVYAVNIFLGEKEYKGMLYIGRRPTLYSDVHKSIEVNIFDFNEDIYGKSLKVEILKYIRRDVKFESIEILRRQLELDEQRVREFIESK